tara:strand:- start:169 stop:426 length:258 start_codon:yes stop_codon:yes gene_type:complete
LYKLKISILLYLSLRASESAFALIDKKSLNLFRLFISGRFALLLSFFFACSPKRILQSLISDIDFTVEARACLKFSRWVSFFFHY